MAHEDRDFAGFAAARWASLVRTAVLLGAPVSLAPEIATLALARLQGRWHRLGDRGDPEVEALRLLLEAWSQTRREDWWDRHPAEPTASDFAALDTVEPRRRAEAVLRHLLELDPAVVEAVLDATVGPDRVRVEETAWAQARSAPVVAPVPSTGSLRRVDRERRARRTRCWLVRLAPTALVLALVIAISTLATRRTPEVADPDGAGRPVELSRAATSRTTTPETWVTWYAAGELHLGPTVIELPGVSGLVGVSGGAVYVDADGQVVRVSSSGRRIKLGLTDSPSSLVATADGGLVGWADTARSGARVLTVVDGDDGRRRRTLALPEDDDSRPVGLLADRMYVVRSAQTYAWRLRDGTTTPVAPLPMLAFADPLVAFGSADPARAPSVGITSIDAADRLPAESSWLRLPGDEAALAPDAGIVLVRSTGGDVLIRDLATGRDLPAGIAPSEVALAAVLGSGGRVAYVVARRAERPEADDEASTFGAPVTVRTCTLSLDRLTTTCAPVALVSGPAAVPLLAR